MADGQKTLMSSLQNNNRIPRQTSGKGQLHVTSQHSATGMAQRWEVSEILPSLEAVKVVSNIIMDADSRHKTSGQAQRTLSSGHSQQHQYQHIWVSFLWPPDSRR